MFKHSMRLAFAAVTLITVAVTPAPADAPIQIAISGLYEYDYQIRPGGDWWGIFPDGKDGYSLQPTRVSAVPDLDLADAPEKAPRQILVNGKPMGTIVFRGLMAAATGPLDVVELPEYPGLIPALMSIKLSLKSGPPESAIRIEGKGREVVEQSTRSTFITLEDYRMVLRRGEGEGAVEQVLFKAPAWGGEGPRLLWAGDLDRDG